jgi:exodeoxyribonuclease VII small subunit
MSHTEDVQNLTYEQARDELIAIVAKLEAGSATLDESLGLWERGEALGARCQELLDGARERITEARGEEDEDLDPQADAGVVAVIADEEDDE